MNNQAEEMVVTTNDPFLSLTEGQNDTNGPRTDKERGKRARVRERESAQSRSVRRTNLRGSEVTERDKLLDTADGEHSGTQPPRRQNGDSGREQEEEQQDTCTETEYVRARYSIHPQQAATHCYYTRDYVQYIQPSKLVEPVNGETLRESPYWQL